MKTLLIGLGNPILGDDGVGWRVAEQLQVHENLPPGVEVDMLAVGGISLMERMIGYERAILVDAIVSGEKPLGTVRFSPLGQIPNRAFGHTGSAHDTTLHNALQAGRELGAQLPEDITVVTIESQNVYDFSEELSPAVAARVPEAVDVVLKLLTSSPVGQCLEGN